MLPVMVEVCGTEVLHLLGYYVQLECRVFQFVMVSMQNKMDLLVLEAEHHGSVGIERRVIAWEIGDKRHAVGKEKNTKSWSGKGYSEHSDC